jgi:hypothetical protein
LVLSWLFGRGQLPTPRSTHVASGSLVSIRPCRRAVSIPPPIATDWRGLDPEKVRQAILAIKGYAGAESTYKFDMNGDGIHGYNVVKNNNGTIVFDRHIDFDD